MGGSITGAEYPYRPITNRPGFAWPNGGSVAVWVAPNIEQYEWLPRKNAQRAPFGGRVTYPDVREYHYRDYGNVSGMGRMLLALDEYEIPCTVSLNAGVLDVYPQLRQIIGSRPWEVMSHGWYNTEYWYENDEQWQIEQLHLVRDFVQERTGKVITGFLGPAISGASCTPGALAASSYTYHADWVNDDQPVLMSTPHGPLWSMPYSYQTDDLPLLFGSPSAKDFVDRCLRQFDQLVRDAETWNTGLVMCLALHPFVMGQPANYPYLKDLLRQLRSRPEAWFATASDVLDVYMRLPESGQQ